MWDYENFEIRILDPVRELEASNRAELLSQIRGLGPDL
jgi:hypothetical protein